MPRKPTPTFISVTTTFKITGATKKILEEVREAILGGVIHTTGFFRHDGTGKNIAVDIDNIQPPTSVAEADARAEKYRAALVERDNALTALVRDLTDSVLVNDCIIKSSPKTAEVKAIIACNDVIKKALAKVPKF